MDPRRVSRLVEQTAVGEGERDEVSKGVTVGDGPPASREAEGEGGEDFYIERRVLSAPRPFHTIRVICGNALLFILQECGLHSLGCGVPLLQSVASRP